MEVMTSMWRSATALVALLIGAAGCGEDSPGLATLPVGSEPVVSAPVTTPAPSPTSTPMTVVTVPVVASTVPVGGDPADRYLTGTTEIYRRTLSSGEDFVVRLSAEPYATVFGLVWKAPTGSAELCLGDHAVFLGVPGHFGGWGSAWVTQPWYDSEPAEPVAVRASMQAAGAANPPTEYLLLQTETEATEVVLSTREGSELDRVAVVDGLAMIIVDPDNKAEGQTINDLWVTRTMHDGQLVGPTALTPTVQDVPPECGPGDPPQRPLPDPGEQPADPDGAAEQIRQRLLLLVDLSIPADQKPDDLVDDDTGVRDAIDRLEASQYADLAHSATYEIDELVFTEPDEAWYRYTITTSAAAATYTNMFGIAVFNGDVWQITRATICQDLAAAAAPCQPEPAPIEPPTTPEWESAWMEWTKRASLYTAGDGCAPLSQC